MIRATSPGGRGPGGGETGKTVALGFQTEEFLSRLDSYRDLLPGPIGLMAEAVRSMIREIENPTAADIRKLHGEILRVIGCAENLIELCGPEGRWCASRCPFGAYLPQGVLYASETAPFCLPWTALKQGDQGGPPEGPPERGPE